MSVWAFGGLYFKRTNPGFSHTLAHTNGKKGSYCLHPSQRHKRQQPSCVTGDSRGDSCPRQIMLVKTISKDCALFALLHYLAKCSLKSANYSRSLYCQFFFSPGSWGENGFIFWGSNGRQIFYDFSIFFFRVFRLYCMRGKSNMFLIIK